MERGRSLLTGTLTLTATAVLMRTIGLLFQVFLSNRIGEVGIGLFQLIGSVSVFAQTVAISGIRFTTTRLVSEELGRGGDTKAVVRKCVGYAAFMGTVSALALYSLSSFLGERVIGDARTVLSLRILAVSLPWMSMGTVYSGYFTAVCRVMKSAVTQLFEQLIRIVTVLFALTLAREGNLSEMCAAVVAGGITGETLSFFFALVLYRYDVKRYGKSGKPSKNVTKRMFSVAVPLALSAYARTALTSLESLFIPRGLRKSGASADDALAGYGKINGMVFPVITFPAAFFASLSELIVPTLTTAQVRGKREYISRMVSRLLRLCLVFSLGVTAVMVEYADELGLCIYKSAEVGHYIRVCAYILPILYLDTVTDGMLRGLGQHLWCMFVNIGDSLFCLLLIPILLPRFAVGGYVAILYLSEIGNFAFSIGRLFSVTRLRYVPGVLLKGVFASYACVKLSRLVVLFCRIPAATGWGLALCVLMSAGFFLMTLAVFGVLPAEDTAWLRGILGSLKKERRILGENPRRT